MYDCGHAIYNVTLNTHFLVVARIYFFRTVVLLARFSDVLTICFLLNYYFIIYQIVRAWRVCSVISRSWEIKINVSVE